MVPLNIPITNRTSNAVVKDVDRPNNTDPIADVINVTVKTNLRPYRSAIEPHKIAVTARPIMNELVNIPAYNPAFSSLTEPSSIKNMTKNPLYGKTLLNRYNIVNTAQHNDIVLVPIVEGRVGCVFWWLIVVIVVCLFVCLFVCFFLIYDMNLIRSKKKFSFGQAGLGFRSQ
jgi:hypothetical protein